jgi:starch synthase
MIEVLAAASEYYPLIKTGGLADVAGALPTALKPHGVTTRTLVPGYPAIMQRHGAAQSLHDFPDLFGGHARLLAVGDLLVLDAPHLYARAGNPYLGADGKDWPDNWRRFAALSLAAAEIGRGIIENYQPQIIHAHDWQTALAPVYLRYRGGRAKSVLTVHNLAFQGQFPSSIFAGLDLPASAYAIDGVEYYGAVGFLKGGLASANAITTVSPTYAAEIATPEQGMGLDGLIRARRAMVTGIVNGIDIEIWDPARDQALSERYDARQLAKRQANKRAIERRFELERDDGPLFCVVSRLTWQKGMDILADTLDELVGYGARLALLGSGEAWLEQAFAVAAGRHRGRIGMIAAYDEPLSHLLQGGSDAILVPSRFEPCGLTQLYGLRYGCVPVVAKTGGLADTVIDANDAALSAGVATGIHFASADAAALDDAIRRACALFGDTASWAQMQRMGMKTDVSWERSAARYAALYRRLIG